MRPRGPQDEAKMGSRRAPWRRLGGLGPGRSWVVLGASWRAPVHLGLPWGPLSELFGPLLKAPLRDRENHENRRQYSTLPGASGRLLALLGASWGCLEPLWASPRAVCVVPGPSLGGSRPVATHRNSRNVSQGKSKSSLAVKS